METLKHQKCPEGWEARLRCSWLSQGKRPNSESARNPSTSCNFFFFFFKEEKEVKILIHETITLVSLNVLLVDIFPLLLFYSFSAHTLRLETAGAGEGVGRGVRKL